MRPYAISFALGAIAALFVATMMPWKPNVDINFVNRACLIPNHGFDYNTCSDFTVLLDGQTITAPKGMSTDLASIPRFLWAIYPPQYTAYVDAAVLHDYLYSCPEGRKRLYIDDVLYAGLLKDGASGMTAANMWIAVRIFGGPHFNKKGTCDV